MTRVCTNLCGQGAQICEDGEWTVCTVPDRSRSCTNDCGRGTQLCHEGQWQGCVVLPARVECENDCGRGTQSCIENQKGVCEVAPVTRQCSSICGPGTETCENGQWQPCTAPQPGPPWLPATVRDFRTSFPGMELAAAQGNWDDRNLVTRTLGEDDKPIFLPPGDTLSTRGGKAVLDQWYRDVPGVNQATQIRLPLTSANGRPGVYRYENLDFFPIDYQLFGNDTPGHPEHNYHFTVEVVTRFRYQGGETLNFAGDDDVWVFLNRGLVIDLGGVHQIERASVELDRVAPGLGMVPGEVYPMHIFFAERHTTESHFLLETSITEFASCD